MTAGSEQEATPTQFVSVIKALGLAGIGSIGAYFLSFPAPFLTGSAIAVIAASLAGQRLSIPDRLRDACFVVIGMSIGAGVTPEVYRAALTWPLSFAILIGVLALIMAAGSDALARLWQKDRATAALAATPGHLSYVLGLAFQTRSDVKWVGVVQSTRVAALTLIVPFTVVLFGLEPSTPGQSAESMSPLMLATTLALAVVAGFALRKTRTPAAFLLSGMLVSAGVHLAGWTSGQVPAWLSWPSFAIMGALIGSRFSGISRAELRRSLGAGLVLTTMAFVISGLGALSAAYFVGLPPALVLVAFAPGGVEAMAAMALTLGLDPAYVAAHHVFRLLVLIVLAPLALFLVGRLGGPRT